jgi:hypothetical protein
MMLINTCLKSHSSLLVAKRKPDASPAVQRVYTHYPGKQRTYKHASVKKDIKERRKSNAIGAHCIFIESEPDGHSRYHDIKQFLDFHIDPPGIRLANKK